MRAIFRGYYPEWSDKTYKGLTALFQLDRRAKIGGFSKGMQRQAAILLALSTQPRYLLMDEAFDGLDLSRRNLLRRLLREYAAQKQAVLVASSHNLLELEELADRIGILRGTRLCFDGAVADMRRSCAKYQVHFAQAPDLRALGELGLRCIRRHGACEVTFVSHMTDAALRAALTALGARTVHTLPVTLEEFFLEETEEIEYAFTDIF